MSTTLPAGMSPLECNPHTPLSAISPRLRMRAGYCNSTGLSTEGSNKSYPSYNLYLRFDGDYIHRGPDGHNQNENLTCQVIPFPTLEHSEFKSLSNSTEVVRSVEAQPSSMYPQASIENILSTMVTMMTVFGQNSVGTLHMY